MLGGSGKNDKNCAIWCILGVPKYVIMDQKSTILRIINQQYQKLFAIFLSNINLMCMLVRK